MIDAVRFAGVNLRIALRITEIEAETGERPVIDQIDIFLHEDRRGVLLDMIDVRGESIFVTVPLSPDELRAFRRRDWAKALASWVLDEDEDEEQTEG